MNKNAKIVIVGAGISGISSAILLQILGYTNITIIDKESYIGGKAHSIHINNESIETGAVFITEGSKKLLNLLKILNCKILPIDERSYIYNPKTSQILTSLPTNQQDKILRKERAIIHTIASNINFYKDNPDYYITAKQFCINNDVELYYNRMKQAIYSYGFGNSDTMMALHFIRFALYHGIYYSAKGGMTEIILHLCKHLKCNFLLSSEVVYVDRSKKEIILANNTKVQYDYVIMTVDGFLNNILLSNISKIESEIFNSIIYNNVITLILEHEKKITEYKPIPKDEMIHLNSCAIYPHNIIAGITSKSNNIVYVYLHKDNLKTLEEHIEVVKQTLYPLLGNMKLIFAKEWSHFNRPSDESIKSGFYSKLESIQGTLDTYFINEAFGYAMLGACFDYAEYIINSNFKER